MGCGVLYLIMPGSCRHRTQDTRVRDRSRADEDTPCNRPGVHAVTVGSSQAANLRVDDVGLNGQLGVFLFRER